MKITKSQLTAIIKEEALKFKRATVLKKELAEIEKQLNEVKAGEVMEPGTGGVHAGQKKAVFATKNGNPNLKMEDGIEDTADVDMDAEVPAAGGEMMSKDEVRSAIHDLEVRLGLSGGEAAGAEVGAEIGAEVGAEVAGEEGEEEFEFDTDNADGEAAGEEDADEKEVTEYGDEHQVATKDAVASMPVKEEEKEVKEEETVKENLDEPIEGKSIAQDAKEAKESAPFDEKTKHVKEATEAPATEVVSEAEVKTEAVETIAEAEKKRMAFLAGILKG